MGWNPSDHVPVSVNCDLSIDTVSAAKLASCDILSDHSLKEYSKPKKIDPKKVDWSVYKDIVSTDFNFYHKTIENLSEQSSLHNLNTAVDTLSNSLYKAASTGTSQNNTSRNEEVVQRGEVFKLADEAWNSYRRGNSNFDAWNSARNEALST